MIRLAPSSARLGIVLLSVLLPSVLLPSVLFASALFVAPAARAQQSIVDEFERRSLTHEGLTLPYRLFVPEDYDAAQAYPLVLALHGAGERGDDNERHIASHRLATSWADPARQATYPAFVVAPQVPSGARWTADADPVTSEFNAVQLTTLAILDALEAEFNIDPDRIYVVGLSLGGHGTWDFVSRLPDRFAAAVPMSGIGYASQAERIAHVPIWAFHDEGDTVVPVAGSRNVVRALEALGREVVYTECRAAPPGATFFDCPDPLGTDTLAAAIEAHADLIFTAEPDRSHGPWAPWFDRPLLADWLYAKVRVTPDAFAVTAPTTYATATGTFTVTWTSIVDPDDAVEVWLSTDEATTWTRLGTTTAGAGTFSFDAAAFDDAAFATVRLAVLDADGRVYGQADTPFFAIDNAGDAPPALALDDAPLRLNDVWTADEVELGVRATDPEGQALTLEIRYSLDDGMTYQLVGTQALASSPDSQPVTVELAALPNAAEARLRVDLSDGTHTVSATSVPFTKATPRASSIEAVTRVAGDGVGTVELVYVDEGALTGHTYRLTIDDGDLLAKTYTVTDLDAGMVVLADEPFSDGVRESPVFDGLRLVVTQPDEGLPDLDASGWRTGGGDLSVTINGDEAFLALQRIPMLATETTYDLTIADAVVDTSLALFAVPAQTMRFTVTGAEDGRQRDVLYRDVAADGRPWSGDQLFILEEDADGELTPAWELRFNGQTNGERPAAGDVYRFVPLSRLGSADVFEFVGRPVAAEDDAGLFAGTRLDVYPNPTPGDATVAYVLTAPAHVRIEVFDVLGRRVAVLADAPADAGPHEVAWTALDLASGVHVVRLTAAPLDGGPTQRLHRRTTRLR